MKKFLYVIIGLVVAFFGFGFILAANDPQSEERRIARERIDYCDSQWKDELKPLDQRRFIRDACDRARENYRKKYNREP